MLTREDASGSQIEGTQIYRAVLSVAFPLFFVFCDDAEKEEESTNPLPEIRSLVFSRLLSIKKNPSNLVRQDAVVAETFQRLIANVFEFSATKLSFEAEIQ